MYNNVINNDSTNIPIFIIMESTQAAYCYYGYHLKQLISAF